MRVSKDKGGPSFETHVRALRHHRQRRKRRIAEHGDDNKIVYFAIGLEARCATISRLSLSRKDGGPSLPFGTTKAKGSSQK